ncbi:MAG TPA: thiamine phosphate synthase [Polyangiaceae bacterium]|jgi:thiamine-phosphate pyrophosphorylase|nr:thiamine phosphate synthase [Polyangiaceae bacterium]
MRGLYAIIDVDFLSREKIALLPFAESVCRARPAAVQLRAKHASVRDTMEWLRQIREFSHAHGVLLFANDRPDVAVIAGCDGVHVGQGDLDPADVRRFAPNLRIGISTHDLPQLDAALRAAPSYVAYGPIFATRSKVNPDPVVGLDGLGAAAERCRGRVPLVAIGGVDLGRASDVARLAPVAAVISGLLPDDGASGVQRRAAELHRVLSDGA